MPVNLNALDISLDQFNAAASGKYNIGQIKLASDGASVVRTNNHKSFTVFNNTRIAPEESLAVKAAFCKALGREGLSRETVDAIRRRLGLGSGFAGALRAGDVKPLSAAEVRDIIDGCAEQINAARGSRRPKLQTSRELYRDVSAETIAERKEIRDEINAESVDRMDTRASDALARFVDILHADGPRSDWPDGTKRIAREMFLSLARGGIPESSRADGDLLLRSAPITLFRARDGKIRAKCELPDGRTFTVGTDKTRNELSDHLATILGSAVRAGDKAKARKPAIPARPPVPSPREVIGTLKQVVSVVRDEREMAKLGKQVRGELHGEDKNGRPYTDKQLDTHASCRVREKLTDKILEKLVPALRKARGNDERNAELANRVRAFVNGDKTVDPNALLEEVVQALGAKKPAAAGPKPGDDPDKPLQIDDLLGNA